MSFLGERSGSLLLSSSSRSFNFFYLRLKNTRFAFFTLFLYFFLNSYFKENRVTTAIMLCLDDKLYQDDVLMILEELEVQNSHLNLLLLKTNFRQKSLSTSGQ